MKVLLTGAFSYTKEQIEYIESLGNDVMFVQDERVLIEFDVSDIEAVVCNALFLYTPIERFASLRLVQLTSAGLERVPMDYIKERNIKICNARGVYSAPMAEFAISGVLQLYKQSAFFYENKKAHLWEKHRGLRELTQNQVLVVGAGSIGTEVAKRFGAFDCEVYGFDICPMENPYFKKVFSFSDLDKMLPSADVVVLTLPLTADTEGFFNKDKFDIMKADSVFVNIARGKLVDETDLITALDSGKISGAVIDVFAEEPLNPASPLWDFPNAVITPHNSFVSNKTNQRMFEIISQTIIEFCGDQNGK